MQLKQMVAAALIAGAAASAFAGQAGEDARIHFSAIAAGDVATAARQYADNAVLEWVGGPLDGTYVGADKIRETWSRFAKANPELRVTVGQVEESANPKGATVTANVQFEGKQPIKVRYVLTYRDGKLVHETWQVDPKLAVTAAY
jgi:ketosteroid isomerase-like protein